MVKRGFARRPSQEAIEAIKAQIEQLFSGGVADSLRVAAEQRALVARAFSDQQLEQAVGFGSGSPGLRAAVEEAAALCLLYNTAIPVRRPGSPRIGLKRARAMAASTATRELSALVAHVLQCSEARVSRIFEPVTTSLDAWHGSRGARRSLRRAAVAAGQTSTPLTPWWRALAAGYERVTGRQATGLGRMSTI